MIERDKIIAGLIAEEGFKPSAYVDTTGNLTIGHGICIDAKRGCGITVEESKYLLGNRLNSIIASLDKNYPWWRDLPEGPQEALCQMSYQLGISGLAGFRRMLEALQFGRYDDAADECLNSLYAKQTPSRAHRMSELIRGGKHASESIGGNV